MANGFNLSTLLDSVFFRDTSGSNVLMRLYGNTPIAVASTPAAQTLTAAQNAMPQVYDLTLTQNTTLSLAGGKSGIYQTIVLVIRQNATAGWVPTLPSNIRWSGGVAPTPNTVAGKIDKYTITTPDGGTTWFGSN